MHRNDHVTAIRGLHTKGDPQTNRPPTVVTDALMNALQEELAHVVEAYLPKLEKADNFQLLKAIRLAISGTINNTLAAGEYVTHPELGRAAYKNIGAGADQVATGNHGHPDLTPLIVFNQHQYAADPHSQYELKARLGASAYKPIGPHAGHVAAGDHTHPELGNSARAYYADVYAHGATSSGQAHAIAASALPIKNGDTMLVRWQQYYEYGTGNGTAGASRSVYTYWLYHAGWYVIMERM